MDRTHHVNLNSLVSSSVDSEWISPYSSSKSPMSCFFMSAICYGVNVISSLFAVLSKAVPGFSWCFVVVSGSKPDKNVTLPFSAEFLFCSNEFALQIRIFDLRSWKLSAMAHRKLWTTSCGQAIRVYLVPIFDCIRIRNKLFSRIHIRAHWIDVHW